MNPHTPEGSPLGRNSPTAEHLDAGLLYPLPRQPQRAAIGIEGALPFLGADAWTAYELSWLNPKGKPQVALAHISVPCESSHMVESKSFKLYLNSFNQTAFESADAVRELIRQDLSAAIWWGGPVRAQVGISLRGPDAFGLERLGEPEGLCLDRLDVECPETEPAPGCLAAALDEKPVQESLYTQLFRSNCPVTGQPDWASVRLRYSGPQIDQAGLLRYLVSFRRHNGFHEACVERIFQDVWRQCKPAQLLVHARFTRRGGLDISPWRSSHPTLPPATIRSARQ